MTQPLSILSNSIFTFQVKADQAAWRLDKFMVTQFPAYSRTFLQEVISNSLITINGISVSKSSAQLKEHDIIKVTFPPAATQATQNAAKKDYSYNISIVAKEEHFLIINKPAGLMVHKAEGSDSEPTVVDWIINNFEEIKHVGAIDRPGIVHRLDKETSGLLVIPRTNHAHTQFGAMFKDRTIHKTYLALVHGAPPQEGTINLPVGRHPTLRHKMTTFAPHDRKSGIIRDAITHYKVLRYFKDAALVEAKPVTGRTHQIRVHFAALGHSLLGDKTYGRASKLIHRHALHAHAIEFEFENKSHLFTCPLPQDFESTLDNLEAVVLKLVQ